MTDAVTRHVRDVSAGEGYKHIPPSPENDLRDMRVEEWKRNGGHQPFPGENGRDYFAPCEPCKARLPFGGKLCPVCRGRFRRFHQLGEYRRAGQETYPGVSQLLSKPNATEDESRKVGQIVSHHAEARCPSPTRS